MVSGRIACVPVSHYRTRLVTVTRQAMKAVFDQHYHADFHKAGLLDSCGGELSHLISDAATMQVRATLTLSLLHRAASN